MQLLVKKKSTSSSTNHSHAGAELKDTEAWCSRITKQSQCVKHVPGKCAKTCADLKGKLYYTWLYMLPLDGRMSRVLQNLTKWFENDYVWKNCNFQISNFSQPRKKPWLRDALYISNPTELAWKTAFQFSRFLACSMLQYTRQFNSRDTVMPWIGPWGLLEQGLNILPTTIIVYWIWHFSSKQCIFFLDKTWQN